MAWRIGPLLLVMIVSGIGAALGGRSESEWGPFLGAMVGLVVGGAAAVAVLRRRG